MRLNTGKVTFSVVGLGGRSMTYLNALEEYFKGQYQVVAVADPDQAKRDRAKLQYGLCDNMLFYDDIAFMKEDRLSDVAIIGTQDALHFREAVALLEKGYDLILEKPISTNLDEIKQLYKISKSFPNQIVAVCHVLRHSDFFNKIKEIVDSQKLGEVVTIQHNENVGYYHFAHSYVRGSWNNSNTSGPVILTKSCHDLDMLLYLLGENVDCKSISSVGHLSVFCEKNFDKDRMSPYCPDCSLQNECAFSAVRIYSGTKIKSQVFDLSSVDKIKQNLGNSPYGRCVYKCDNNVCDHQSTILDFSNGVTATFNLSAFTAKVNRSLKIMCRYGEIRAIEKPYLIETTDFRTDETQQYPLDIQQGGHGGADKKFVIHFMNSYLSGEPFNSTLSKSLQSHIMALYAEKSRLEGGSRQDISQIIKDIEN